MTASTPHIDQLARDFIEDRLADVEDISSTGGAVHYEELVAT